MIANLRTLDPARLRSLAGLALVGLLLGLALGTTRDLRYESSTALRVVDPLATLDAEVAPVSLIDSAATLADSSEVIDLVAAENPFGLTAAQLGDAVTVSVTETELTISAEAESAELAASIATALGAQVETLAKRSSRQSLADAAERLRDSEDPGDVAALARIETALADDPGVSVLRSANLPGSPDSGGLAIPALLGGVIAVVLGLVFGFGIGPEGAGRTVQPVGTELIGPDGRTPGRRIEDLGAPQRRRADQTRVGSDRRLRRVARIANPAALAKSLIAHGSGADAALLAGLVELAATAARGSAGGAGAIAIADYQADRQGADLAVAMAAAISADGGEVLVVEMRDQGTTLASRIGLLVGPGISDYLVGQATPPEIIQEVEIGGRGGGLLVAITAGTRPLRRDGRADERFREFVSKVVRAYDYVILDIGAGGPYGAIAVEVCGAAIVCAPGAEIGPATAAYRSDDGGYVGVVEVD